MTVAKVRREMRQRLEVVANCVLVCAACVAGALVGSAMRFPQIGTAILFPPYAVLTTALLFSPTRRWWLYLLAAAAGDLGPHLASGAAPVFAFAVEVPNFARALVAAAGVRRFGGARGRLDTIRGMAAFLVFAVLLGPLVGALLGASVSALHRGTAQFLPAFRTWLLSNTLTGITFLPIIIIGVGRVRDWRRGRPRSRPLAAALLALALLTVCGLLLLRQDSVDRPLVLWAPLPLLLWAAVQFGPLGTSASLLVVAVMAIAGSLRGRGPFATGSPAMDLLHLQLFLVMSSLPLLLLSALLEEQRATADDLRASRERYRDVVEDQTEFICRFRPDGALTFVNGAWCRSLKRSSDELLGASFWSLLQPEQPAAEELARLTPDSQVLTWESALPSPPDDPRWEQWRVRALFDERGHLSEYQAVGRDITERKQAEESRRQLEAEQRVAEALREADRRKDEFLAILGHELRNPLAPIVIALELLREAPPGDAAFQWARDAIARQVAQLARLVDDLLDVARVSSGHIQLQLESIDLGEVIARAVETSRPLMEAKAIDLTVAPLPSPRRVKGDDVRLIQIVSNLLSNAAKYTDPGGQVRLTVAREDETFALRFTDTGVGIPAEMLERVFEPFTQANPARDIALGGLGVGLSLVRRLIELHGGTVHAHSDGPGKGCEFVARLPASSPDASTSDGPVAPARPLRPPSPEARRVLVVDDSRDAADSLVHMLRLEGHQVEVAYDGLAGLESALRATPEVVFLDLRLPQMDGLEVARRLRGRFDSSRMVLIATTGLGQPADRRRSADAGFNHHLTKPIDLAAVRTLLVQMGQRRRDVET
jgi:PAS domain S-box-containing protein